MNLVLSSECIEQTSLFHSAPSWELREPAAGLRHLVEQTLSLTRSHELLGRPVHLNPRRLPEREFSDRSSWSTTDLVVHGQHSGRTFVDPKMASGVSDSTAGNLRERPIHKRANRFLPRPGIFDG